MLNSVTKSFGKKQVIKSVSFDFQVDYNYRISGENGIGKTTLLKMLANILIPDTGEIDFKNQTSIGWVPSTELGLFGRLTGAENIQTISGLLQVDKNFQNQMTTNWSKINPFKESLITPFYKCSSGMKQVLKIFCSILHGPELLIMDEPFRNLDESVRLAVATLIQEQSSINQIIYSDHYIQERPFENLVDLSLSQGGLVVSGQAT